MYGANTLQISDARPTFRTLVPLYQKALLRGKLHAFIAAVTGRSSRLLSLAEMAGNGPKTNQRPSSMQTVRIADIRGSEDRSDDFDRNFNPLQTHTKSRWLSIATARLNGVAMPAVELIKAGDSYAVRDGHHRISVARMLGEDYIDAYVTSWSE